MVWICKSCGEGNLDSHHTCIKCDSQKTSQSEKNIHCWDYLDCDRKNRKRCIVYIKKNGNRCYDYKRISRRCIGHGDKTCDDCKWFQLIQDKIEIEQ